MENCGRILLMTSGSGLVRLERASRKLALREFDQFVENDVFMDVGEEVLGLLLDDDALISESEERVLKGVVRWMKGEGGGKIRGEGLLRKIRFPFMTGAFLADEARGMLPETAGLEGLVLESCMLKSMAADLWAGRELRYLDAKVLVPRRGLKWGRRLPGLVGLPVAALCLFLAWSGGAGIGAVWLMTAAAFFSALGAAPAWAVCLDIGREHAGTVSGSMNMFGNLGGALIPIVTGYTRAGTGSWTPALMSMAGCYLLAAVAWGFIDATRRIEPAAEA
jgi:hypothetical protein